MIYFDSAATTCPFNDVLLEYNKVSKESFANPSSIHNLGFQANRIYQKSKERILKLTKLDKDFDLVFTAGASEANNVVLKGLSAAYKNRGKTILVSSIEHPSVSVTANELVDAGFFVKYIPVDGNGRIIISELEKLLSNDVILVSIIAVNNETGVKQDFAAISKLIRKYPKIIFHSDITQALGKENFDYSLFDCCSFSGHKFHGLKGCGGLFYKKKLMFKSLVNGGNQQSNVRAGTLDIASIAAMTKALELSYEKLSKNYQYICDLQAYLMEKLSKIEEIELNSNELCSPYIVNFSFKEHKSSVLVEGLSEKEIYVSSISACSSKKENVSSVLLAMGKGNDLAANSMRVSFSAENTKEEIDVFIDELNRLLVEVRRR